MTGIPVEAAIIAAAGRDGHSTHLAVEGFLAVREWMEFDQVDIFKTPERTASLLGQTAHESSGYSRDVENMNYTTAKRIRAVFGKRRFPTLAVAERYVREPEMLANKVYGLRMGNTRPNDGYRYRGRGWLQLTGRSNYRKAGEAIGVDLDKFPDLAASPKWAWKIAAEYLATRSRQGRTALEWADVGDVEQVTRIVNGGTNGLEDRRTRTSRALAVLKGE